MKKSTQLLSAAIIVTMLYSCSSTRESAFQKRKYYDFKHGETEIALNKGRGSRVEGREVVEREAAGDIKQQEDKLNGLEQTITKTEQVRTNTSVQGLVSIAKSNMIQKAFISRKIKQAKAEEKITTVGSQTELQKKNNSGTKPSDADTALVLYVILCILIPPVAVFLKEDAITTNFWIDLILTLLFWVPGVIFAFLVVFNII
jgi:uncharacterized membrane protein YqaE (UPF0057 family)